MSTSCLYWIIPLSVVISTILYLYLHKKTHINLAYLYKDNIINIVLTDLLVGYVSIHFGTDFLFSLIFLFLCTIGFCVVLTLIRFYRIPLRKVVSDPNAILSPADGNVIYIKKISSGEIPIAVKNGMKASLTEFTQTDLLNYPCWLIGINMTPFDVHKNNAPIDGKIILNKHIDGQFKSLKEPDALQCNERNSIVIDNPKGKIGVVQTASRLVRRIITYKKEGESLAQGDWYGMIKFGSQVDIIIPANCILNIQEKQQVYARKTIIAKWE